MLIEQAWDNKLEKTLGTDRLSLIVRRADLYKKLGDKQNAVKEFQRIIQEYPASPSADYAEVQLKDLGARPVPGPRMPATNAPIVYIQFNDPADESLAQLLRNALQSQGLKTRKSNLAKALNVAKSVIFNRTI